jgi:hypothetical protein
MGRKNLLYKDGKWLSTILMDLMDTIGTPAWDKWKPDRKVAKPPPLAVHRNRIDRHHRRRQRRELVLLLSFRDTPRPNLWPFLLLYARYDRALGHYVLNIIGCKATMPQNANSTITIYTTPSPPALYRFSMPSLPIPCQIALNFLPPLHDLLATLSPVKSRRPWVQTFLPEYVHDVFEFRIPLPICSFFYREREEQGLCRVERDLSVREQYSCG